MAAILLTIIMMVCVIITMPLVNLLTTMEMASVTITVLTVAEKVRDMLTQTEMVSVTITILTVAVMVQDMLTQTVTVFVTTIPPVRLKTVPALGGGIVVDRADVADKK